MANLINGNGYPAVYADQDADWYASIMGNVTSITGVGQQFEATILDAQTIGVADGVIITKEGRRIQLDANQVDTFDIPVGEQGTTNYYIIGYQLVTQEDSSQVAETFVQLMENATDTIEEETFRGGADEVYVSLYRVTQVGLSITSIDLLLPVIPNMQKVNQLESDLTELHKHDFGTPIAINNGSTYTCPSDGMVLVAFAYIYPNTSTNNLNGSVYLNDVLVFSDEPNVYNAKRWSMPVRKGTVIKYTAVGQFGNSCQFVPFV